MPHNTRKLEDFCSPKELAYAAANPHSRFAQAMADLKAAVEVSNAPAGPGQPSRRLLERNLDAAIGAKEDAYWGVSKAIEATPAEGSQELAEPVTFAL